MLAQALWGGDKPSTHTESRMVAVGADGRVGEKVVRIELQFGKIKCLGEDGVDSCMTVWACL